MRSRLARVALAAWVNVDPDKLPADKMWIEHPSDANRQAWDRVIDALFEAFEADHGWRTIDSAPTNASVLVFVPNADHYGHGVYRAMLVDMGTGRRWMTSGLHIGRDCSPDNQPTHWQPLPAAPMLPQPKSPQDDQKPQQNQTPNGGGEP